MIPEKQKSIRLCLTGILCVLLFFLSVSTAQGRFRETHGGEASFQAVAAQQVSLSCLGGTDWTYIGAGSGKMDFLVSCPAAESDSSVPLWFTVRVAVTQGIQNADNVQIKLEINGGVYTASATPILAGTTRYETFGPGWLYRFYDSDGNELSWELLSGNPVAATLTVEGAANMPACCVRK